MSVDDPHHPRDEEPLDPAAELQAALERSRRHARAALSEAAACTRALLDAACLATTGVPVDDHGLIGRLAETLGDAAVGLAPEQSGLALADALAEALDQEIARWELRAGEDPEARAVLRAFLGVRELLWELGVRRQNGSRHRSAAPVRARENAGRVHVQGA